jgi:hypothetical protein
MNENNIRAFYTLAIILLIAKLQEMANATKVEMQYSEK